MQPESKPVGLPKPSAEWVILAGIMFHLSERKPRKLRRLMDDLRAFTSARRRMSAVLRIRHAKYDAATAEACDEAEAWIDFAEPVMARLIDEDAAFRKTVG